MKLSTVLMAIFLIPAVTAAQSWTGNIPSDDRDEFIIRVTEAGEIKAEATGKIDDMTIMLSDENWGYLAEAMHQSGQNSLVLQHQVDKPGLYRILLSGLFSPCEYTLNLYFNGSPASAEGADSGIGKLEPDDKPAASASRVSSRATAELNKPEKNEKTQNQSDNEILNQSFIVTKGSEIIVPGDPALLGEDVVLYYKLLECSFGMPLTQDQKRRLRSAIKTEFEKSPEGRNDVLRIRHNFKRIEQLSEEEQKIFFRSIKNQLLTETQDGPEEAVLLQIVRELADPEASIIVPGDLPLAEQTFAAMIELFEFYGSLSEGRPIKLNNQQRDTLKQSLIERYKEMGKEERKALRAYPLIWGRFRLAWEKAGEQERENFKKQILQRNDTESVDLSKAQQKYINALKMKAWSRIAWANLSSGRGYGRGQAKRTSGGQALWNNVNQSQTWFSAGNDWTQVDLSPMSNMDW